MINFFFNLWLFIIIIIITYDAIRCNLLCLHSLLSCLAFFRTVFYFNPV